ncbi:hypothetical protein M440DRAFT_1461870 [Trichoderma longibrachiatum ATCC 18648]|uniref:Transcription factor domain-containing protein n=1 Tax=Trichoderma longibrachiatum ATCC 18648 TaxID=983965 RepID=A0A2T4CBF6_TRILO|nr:hypothetical protein M440DRAFT_1461870 [Trichoderma longibrachiatum ATCC 18648]
MTEKVSCNTVRPKKQRKKKTAAVEEQKKRTDKPSSTDVASEREGTVDDNRSLTDRPAASLAPLTDSTWENKGERQHTELLGIEEKGENTHFVDPSLPSTWPKVHINDDKCFRIMTSNYNSSIPPRLDAAAYNEYCFVGKFAQLIMSSRRSYSNNRPQSWILELPHLAAKKALPSSLRYAMHAAALLYHAVTTHDDRAKVAAIGWYLAAIHSYRTTILASTPRKAPVAPVPEVAVGSEGLSISEIAEICVPIMFSFYEGLQGSSSDAELLHHAAATEMLERRGPEKCASGLAHSVMRSLRVREAFYSIMQNRSANFSSPEWLSIPFQQKHKICYDRLIDILLSFTKVLRLPGMNQWGATLRRSVNRVHGLSTSRKAEIEEKALTILAQLQEWWLQFRQEHCEIVTLSSECSLAPEIADLTVASPTSVLMNPLSSSWMVANNETLTASMLSLYSATHMILHTTLLIISLSKAPYLIGPDGQTEVDSHQAAVSTYATGVFNASKHLNMTKPFCGDAFRTTFSMTIVSQFALEDMQRDEARRMLNQWRVHSSQPSRFRTAD